ncbi:MAG: PKD domain-containing protein, partial [Cyanobacteria bacterium J06614_10]
IRDGCISDSVFVTFEVVPEPSANFNANNGGICSDDCITYTYTGIPVGPNQNYFWDFGAGAVPPTSSQPNPGCIPYATGGTKDVTLTVSYKGCSVSTTQQVQVNERPSVSAGPDQEFCEGDGGVQLDGTVSGGTSPLFYNWWCDNAPNCGLSSNSIEDPVANPNIQQATDSVKYYFQVTDVNGCVSNIDSTWVIIKAKPVMDAGPDVSICTDGPGDFIMGGLATSNNAPQPLTNIQWIPSNGLGNPNILNPFARPDTTTIYTLVATSVNGCTSDVNTLDTLSTVTVRVLPKPVAYAGRDSALCEGESLLLQGFASGAGPDYSYSWTPNTSGTIDDPTSATPNITPPFTTTYSLVVTSNGCDSDADQVEIIVDNRPTISPGSDETICLGEDVQLNGSAAGDPNGSNYSYSWSPPDGLSDPNSGKPMASPEVTTTYTVSASSQFGCGSDDAQITVTVEPTPEVLALSADTVLCEGDTIELKATHSFTTPAGSPVVYDWTPAGSITSGPSATNVMVSPKVTTLYTVQASIAGDCPTTDQVLVTVSPKVIAAIAADTTRFCEGDATQLVATGGLGNADFVWTPSAGLSDPNIYNPLASPEENITYTVEVSEGACSDTDTIRLEINPTPQADYFASQASGCEGLMVSFIENSDDAIAYRWDFGDGSPLSNESNPTHTYASAGSYVVTLTTIGMGGCETTTSHITVEVSDSGFADFGSDPIEGTEVYLPDASVQFADLSGNAQNWYWSFGDGTISTEANPNHRFTDPGEYTVSLTVTDENGCVSVIEKGFYIVIAPDVMIPNVFSPNNDGVNDVFRVDYQGTEQVNVKIFDRWGRAFFEGDAADKVWDGMDDQGNLAREGVYYYSVNIGEKTYTGNITLLR